MTKPSFTHYFYAADGHLKLWLGGCTVVSAITGGYIEYNKLSPLLTWVVLAESLFFIAVFAGLGYLLALIPATFVFGPMYYSRGLKNGEPFQSGDTVHILVGPYKDSIAIVYKATDQYPEAGWHRIYVRLGEMAKKDGQDVFSSTEILRISPKNGAAKNGAKDQYE